ncbi:MAG: bifunctional adenosylcobinamide kinase/adenosylcobinamide-phosphate guanylyltransferase [Anaerolineae bacterium]|nr:bifunctional adenosylcobinamide kinase/adenosylcobinamide-phosphate guanylyltransferase [Anaerolineae bacterium]
MGEIILILGGARSGKSTCAEQIAASLGGDSVLFVATAEPIDDEIRERITRHRASRPTTWRTVEAPVDAAAALQAAYRGEHVVLLDCLTVLATNLLIRATGPYDDPFDAPDRDPFDETIEAQVLTEINALVAFARSTSVTLLIVSNEVGLGVVPPYDLGRAYRDLLGRANQAIAAEADRVVFMVAGLPLQVK